MLQSGCLKGCPASVVQWTQEQCISIRCKPEQCVFKTSGASRQHVTGTSALLALLATAAALLLG